MNTDRQLKTSLLVAATCVGVLMTGEARAAGLFDFLFGGVSEPQPTSQTSPRTLDVRVNPRRRSNPVAASSPKPRIVSSRPASGERKTVLAKPIDPVKNPEWFLEDPTLKRGDIVVLKNRILVFDGGRTPRVKEDFTSLDKSRLISQSERDRLNKSAGVKDGSDEPKASAAKEASLRPAQ